MKYETWSRPVRRVGAKLWTVLSFAKSLILSFDEGVRSSCKTMFSEYL